MNKCALIIVKPKLEATFTYTLIEQTNNEKTHQHAGRRRRGLNSKERKSFDIFLIGKFYDGLLWF